MLRTTYTPHDQMDHTTLLQRIESIVIDETSDLTSTNLVAEDGAWHLERNRGLVEEDARGPAGSMVTFKLQDPEGTIFSSLEAARMHLANVGAAPSSALASPTINNTIGAESCPSISTPPAGEPTTTSAETEEEEEEEATMSADRQAACSLIQIAIHRHRAKRLHRRMEDERSDAEVCRQVRRALERDIASLQRRLSQEQGTQNEIETSIRLTNDTLTHTRSRSIQTRRQLANALALIPPPECIEHLTYIPADVLTGHPMGIHRTQIAQAVDRMLRDTSVAMRKAHDIAKIISLNGYDSIPLIVEQTYLYATNRAVRVDDTTLRFVRTDHQDEKFSDVFTGQLDPDYIKKLLQRIASDPFLYAYKVYIGNRVVASIVLRRFRVRIRGAFSNAILIDAVATAKTESNQGIGTMLLEVCRRISLEEHYDYRIPNYVFAQCVKTTWWEKRAFMTNDACALIFQLYHMMGDRFGILQPDCIPRCIHVLNPRKGSSPVMFEN